MGGVKWVDGCGLCGVSGSVPCPPDGCPIQRPITTHITRQTYIHDGRKEAQRVAGQSIGARVVVREPDEDGAPNGEEEARHFDPREALQAVAGAVLFWGEWWG